MDELTKKEDDLPRSVIVVLVILAVAISILGTFTVLSEMSKINAAPVYQGGNSQSAKITLTVEDPKAHMSSTTGKITFRVEDRGGKK